MVVEGRAPGLGRRTGICMGPLRLEWVGIDVIGRAAGVVEIASVGRRRAVGGRTKALKEDGACGASRQGGRRAIP